MLLSLFLLGLAETESGIFRQILQGKLDFKSDPWPSISEAAKDLIYKMLERSPKKRISAHEALCKFIILVYIWKSKNFILLVLRYSLNVNVGHPWIVDEQAAPDKPLDPAVLSRLKQFSQMNKIKKMALRVCIQVYVH